MRHIIKHGYNVHTNKALSKDELGFDFKASELFIGPDNNSVTRNSEIDYFKHNSSNSSKQSEVLSINSTKFSLLRSVPDIMTVENFSAYSLGSTNIVSNDGIVTDPSSGSLSIPYNKYVFLDFSTVPGVNYTLSATSVLHNSFIGIATSSEPSVVTHSNAEFIFAYIEGQESGTFDDFSFTGDGNMYTIMLGGISDNRGIFIGLSFDANDSSDSSVYSSISLLSSLNVNSNNSLPRFITNILKSNSISKTDIQALSPTSPKDNTLLRLISDSMTILNVDDITDESITWLNNISKFITYTDKIIDTLSVGEFVIQGMRVKGVGIEVKGNIFLDVKTSTDAKLLRRFDKLIIKNITNNDVHVVESISTKLTYLALHEDILVKGDNYEIIPFNSIYQCIRESTVGTSILDTRFFKPMDHITSQNLYLHSVSKVTGEYSQQVRIGTELFYPNEQDEDTIMTKYYGDKIGDSWEDDNYYYRLDKFSGMSSNSLAFHKVLNPFGIYKLNDKVEEYLNSVEVLPSIYDCVLGITNTVENPLSDMTTSEQMSTVTTYLYCDTTPSDKSEDSILDEFVSSVESGNIKVGGEGLPEIRQILYSVSLSSNESLNNKAYLKLSNSSLYNTLQNSVNDILSPKSIIVNNTKNTVFYISDVIFKDNYAFIEIFNSETSTNLILDELDLLFNTTDSLDIVAMGTSAYTFYDNVPLTQIRKSLDDYDLTMQFSLNIGKPLVGCIPDLKVEGSNVISLPEKVDDVVVLPDASLIKYITDKSCTLKTTEHYILSAHCDTGTIRVFDKYTYELLGELVVPYSGYYVHGSSFSLYEKYGRIYAGNTYKYTNGHKYSGAVCIYSTETFELLHMIDTPSEGVCSNCMYSFGYLSIYGGKLLVSSPGVYQRRDGILYIYDALNYTLESTFKPDDNINEDYFGGTPVITSNDTILMGSGYKDWLNTEDVGVVYELDPNNSFNELRQFRPSLGVYKQRFGSGKLSSVDNYFMSSARSNKIEVYSSKGSSSIPIETITLPVHELSTIHMFDICCGKLIVSAYKDVWANHHSNYGYIFSINIHTYEYTDITPAWFGFEGRNYKACVNDVDGKLIMADGTSTLESDSSNPMSLQVVQIYGEAPYMKYIKHLQPISTLDALGQKVKSSPNVIASDSIVSGSNGSGAVIESGYTLGGPNVAHPTPILRNSNGVIDFDRTSYVKGIVKRTYSLYLDDLDRYIGAMHYTLDGVLDVNRPANTRYVLLNLKK